MPRIRTLKPEHKSHRKVGRLTDRAYRLWISILTESDDDGRSVCDLEQLRALTWPFRHPALKHVRGALETLLRVGLVDKYVDKGVEYLVVPSWHDHQPKDKYHYYPSKLPAPPILTRQSRIADSEEPRKGL